MYIPTQWIAKITPNQGLRYFFVPTELVEAHNWYLAYPVGTKPVLC